MVGQAKQLFLPWVVGALLILFIGLMLLNAPVPEDVSSRTLTSSTPTPLPSVKGEVSVLSEQPSFADGQLTLLGSYETDEGVAVEHYSVDGETAEVLNLYNPSDEDKEVSLILDVPKEFASSASDLEFKSLDDVKVEVLEEDPVVSIAADVAAGQELRVAMGSTKEKITYAKRDLVFAQKQITAHYLYSTNDNGIAIEYPRQSSRFCGDSSISPYTASLYAKEAEKAAKVFSGSPKNPRDVSIAAVSSNFLGFSTSLRSLALVECTDLTSILASLASVDRDSRLSASDQKYIKDDLSAYCRQLQFSTPLPAEERFNSEDLGDAMNYLESSLNLMGSFWLCFDDSTYASVKATVSSLKTAHFPNLHPLVKAPKTPSANVGQHSTSKPTTAKPAATVSQKGPSGFGKKLVALTDDARKLVDGLKKEKEAEVSTTPVDLSGYFMVDFTGSPEEWKKKPATIQLADVPIAYQGSVVLPVAFILKMNEDAQVKFQLQNNLPAEVSYVQPSTQRDELLFNGKLIGYLYKTLVKIKLRPEAYNLGEDKVVGFDDISGSLSVFSSAFPDLVQKPVSVKVSFNHVAKSDLFNIGSFTAADGSTMLFFEYNGGVEKTLDACGKKVKLTPRRVTAALVKQATCEVRDGQKTVASLKLAPTKTEQLVLLDSEASAEQRLNKDLDCGSIQLTLPAVRDKFEQTVSGLRDSSEQLLQEPYAFTYLARSTIDAHVCPLVLPFMRDKFYSGKAHAVQFKYNSATGFVTAKTAEILGDEESKLVANLIWWHDYVKG